MPKDGLVGKSTIRRRNSDILKCFSVASSIFNKFNKIAAFPGN
jgi:hypothetical protein